MIAICQILNGKSRFFKMQKREIFYSPLALILIADILVYICSYKHFS